MPRLTMKSSSCCLTILLCIIVLQNVFRETEAKHPKKNRQAAPAPTQAQPQSQARPSPPTNPGASLTPGGRIEPAQKCGEHTWPDVKGPIPQVPPGSEPDPHSKQTPTMAPDEVGKPGSKPPGGTGNKPLPPPPPSPPSPPGPPGQQKPEPGPPRPKGPHQRGEFESRSGLGSESKKSKKPKKPKKAKKKKAVLRSEVQGSNDDQIGGFEGLDESQAKKRIAGGTWASLKQFPSYVRLDIRLTHRYLASHRCGGVLVSQDKILTAAHCLDQNNTKIEVLAGLNQDRYNNPENMQVRHVRVICLHKNYKKRKLGEVPGAHDLAVIVVDRPFELNDYIQPACLLFKADNMQKNQTASSTQSDNYYAVGFGDTHETRFSHMLLYTNLQKIGCKLEHEVKSNTCYKQPDNHSGICLGDTGGGLYLHRNGKQYIAGIATSFENPVLHGCDINVNTANYFVDTIKEEEDIKSLLSECN